MINPTTDRQTIQSNIDNCSSFTIRASAQAFKILSSGLYSDKVAAVMRELGCNARDSHMSAGKADVPFVVTLPDVWNPTFVIRDFGTGISHEDVLGIYTSYFTSTRNASNDSIGMLGLGSKSPFSLTESFSVVSRHGGKMRTYMAFLNDDGIPNISHVGEEDLSDPSDTGLEVSFAVDAGHMAEFHAKVATVYAYFTPKPVIQRYRGGELPDVKYLLRGESWGVRDYNVHSNRNLAQVVMGGVAYAIPNACDPKADDKSNNIVNSLQNHPIDIFVDIGMVPVAASREILEDSKMARRLILQVGAEMESRVRDTIAKCTSYWEACVAHSKLMGDHLIQSLSSSWSPFVFEGRTVQHVIVVSKKCPVNCGYNQGLFVPDLGCDAIVIHPESKLRPHSKKQVRQVLQHGALNSPLRVMANNNTLFFIDDTPKPIKLQLAMKMVAHYFQSNQLSECDCPQIYIIRPVEKDAVENFKKAVGLPDSHPFIKMSSVDYVAPPRKTVVRNANMGSTTFPVIALDEGRRMPVGKTLPAGQIVFWNRSTENDGLTMAHMTRCHQILKNIIGNKCPDVYALTDQQVIRMRKKNLDLIPLKDFVVSHVKSYMSDKKAHLSFAAWRNTLPYGHERLTKYLTQLTGVEFLKPITDTILADYSPVRSIVEELKVILKDVGWGDLFTPDQTLMAEWSVMLNKLFERCPLLAHLNYSYFYDEAKVWKDIVNYINGQMADKE